MVLLQAQQVSGKR